MPNFNTFANPLSGLFEVGLEIAESGVRASSALTKANNVKLDIDSNIKPQTNKIPELDTKVSTAKNRLDDIEYNKLSDLFQKYGTLDEKLIAEIDRVNGIDNTIKTDIKPKTSKMFSFLGAALDAVDIVGFILDIAETAALAAAIVRVGNNSLARDEELGNRINGLNNEIDEVRNMNTGQYNSIMDSLSGISQRVSAVNSDVDAVNTRTIAIDGKVNDVNSTINLVRNDVSAISNTTNLIKEDTNGIIANTNIIQNQTSGDSIRNRAKEGACLALQTCSNQGDLLNLLNEIKSAIGSGDVFCGTSFIAGNLTDGIAAIYCSGGGDSGGNNNPDIELNFQEQELKLDELLSLLKTPINLSAWNYEIVLNPTTKEYELKQLPPQLSASGQGIDGLGKAIDVIAKRIDNDEKIIFEMLQLLPEPTLFVPDEWSVKIEGNRPQLIAGMNKKSDAGKGSASKWEIVVPHPKNSVLTMSWDELVAYFPDYSRGSWSATIKLKDGSAVRVRANTQNNATIAANRLLKLVNPAMVLDGEKPLYQQNQNFQTVEVTCRGIAYYETGRKEGQKPTKRWYFPVEKDDVIN